jgi:hypothetical protein
MNQKLHSLAWLAERIDDFCKDLAKRGATCKGSYLAQAEFEQAFPEEVFVYFSNSCYR